VDFGRHDEASTVSYRFANLRRTMGDARITIHRDDLASVRWLGAILPELRKRSHRLALAPNFDYHEKKDENRGLGLLGLHMIGPVMQRLRSD
jgi:hypothetical protein